MATHTHHLIYTNKLFSRYNRIVAFSYVGIIIAALLIFHNDFVDLKIKRNQELQSAMQRRSTILERNISHIENAARGVRIYGERYLFMDKKLNIPSPLAERLQVSKDKTYFHLDDPGKDFDFSMIGNLTGSTKFDWQSSLIMEEIRMALNLNPYFQVVYSSLKDAFSISNLSVSYTSVNGFRNLYPWRHSDDYHFSDETLKTEQFKKFLPENNVQKRPLWSEPFFDQHSGLFTLRYSVPLYNDDRFLGVASLDITAKPFKEFLTIHHFYPPSSFYLITNSGTLIASSDRSVSLTEVGKNLFPETLRPTIKKLLKKSDDFFQKPRDNFPSKSTLVNGHLIISSPLKNAPWTLFHIGLDSTVANLFSDAGNHITFIILSLSLLLIIIHILIRREFITPARQLVHHIEKESQGKSDESSKLTQEAWRPWFETITNVFSENSRLIRDLEAHIENLDQKVQDRTKKLAQKNKQLEKAMDNLKIAQEQIILQEKLASLGSLTAGIAHEMKNPLNFIINFSEVSQELVDEIKNDVPKDPHAKELLLDLEKNLSFINDHGHRADNIIRSMLMHSRKHEGEKRLTDMNKLISESASLALSGFKGQQRISDIRIIKKFEENLPHIFVIPEDLGRVFMNLINNACYALLEKSNTSKTSSLVITLETYKDIKDKKIIIQIRDNGTGISKKSLRKIFEPFYTTKPMGKGTGLGLSLSYDIVVQQNKGSLSVESEEGIYTCFTITFPLSQTSENVAKPALYNNQQENDDILSASKISKPTTM